MLSRPECAAIVPLWPSAAVCSGPRTTTRARPSRPAAEAAAALEEAAAVAAEGRGAADEAGATDDEEDAALAWQRTLAFLKQQLG